MSSAADIIRFRCYGCDGVLNAVRVKIGRIVICPRCRAEMIVPDPEASAIAEGGLLEAPFDDDLSAAARLAPPAPNIDDARGTIVPDKVKVIDLPVRIEPAAIRAEGRSPGDRSRNASRDRDVLIPRGVLLAWSLFVVLALGLAFLAGLLAGRSVWSGPLSTFVFSTGLAGIGAAR